METTTYYSIHDAEVQPRLLAYAKENLIDDLKKQLTDCEKRIKYLQERPPKGEEGTLSYNMHYGILYSSNYQKEWLLSKISDLEKK